jgi:hypothetical protein
VHFSTRNKTEMISIIITFLLMTSITLMANVPVNAQLSSTQPTSGALPSGVTVEVTHDTRCFLSIRPNPIGVGQSLLVTMWINPALASNNRFAPDAFKVTFTKPDETTEVFTLDSEPATAAMWFEYYPDQTGDWKVKVDYLGTYFPAGRYYNGYIVTNRSGVEMGSAYYKPSSAPEETLTVQTDMVYSWPPAALPSDYWTRPASLNNREWWPILGNYPSDGYVGGGVKWDELYPNTNPYDSYGRYNFRPWVTGPNSAHIVWKRQDAIAGIIGGMAGIYGMTTGYGATGGNPSVVYEGRCYDTMTVPINGVPTTCAVCYDLRTGEQYYAIPTSEGGVTPSYLGYISPAENALATDTWSVELLTISGGRLYKINPWTGAVTTNVSISPLTGTGGNYYMNNYVLSLQDLGAAAGSQRYRLINWTTSGTSAALTSRIVSNITWPWNAIPNQYVSATGICTADFNVGIASWITRTYETGSEIYWGINITAAYIETGQLLSWNVYVPDETTYSASCIVSDHGKVALLTQSGVWLAYDLQTGKLAWKSEQMDYPFGQPSFGAYAVQSAYGMFFRQSYDGVYAFNWTDGKIVWKYVAAAPASFESPYAVDGVEVYPFNSGGYVADGKMYVANTEHTPSWPRTRGWSLHCINITTGEGIWRITGEQTPGAIVDGYLTAANSWDGYTYVYGKGKSATTVEAPLTAIPLGESVVIQGTVLDLSPAQPNTPCVSQDSMTTQMEYLHMQQPIGGIWGNETMTGVPVFLSALDSNGNTETIGTVTTNAYYGTFSCAWTPPIEGNYTIMANFAGDDSYSSSGASTAIFVGPAPTVAPTQEPLQLPPDNTMLIIAAAVAIIIAIAIATMLLLRKRS